MGTEGAIVAKRTVLNVTENAEIVKPPEPVNNTQQERDSVERFAATIQTQREVFQSKGLTMNFESLIETNFMFQRGMLDRFLDPRRDLDRECGYPVEITPTMYHIMFERDGLSKRVVELFPDESWAVDPEVFDVGNEETEFDTAWAEIVQRLNVWGTLHRADILSGVGRFGVLLLGLDDGLDYAESVEGVDAYGDSEQGSDPRRLLFVRAFEESQVRVNLREADLHNPRFGRPVMYTLTFKDLDITEPAGQGTATIGDVTKRVHWTRVIHLADNRTNSEVYGTPRMKSIFNRLLDIRKVLGGSAEMFWKGAFPGLSFEMHPGIGDAELDQKSLRNEMERYSEGLQRYLAITGMTAKSLAPQIESPKEHLDEQITFICIALGVPKRIFLGSEEAKLASSQDAKAWLRRMARRQDKYLSPMVIRPFVDRLVSLRVIPPPQSGYKVFWANMGAVTDKEKAEIGLLKAQAVSQFIASGGDAVIPIPAFIQLVLGMDQNDIDDVSEVAAARDRDTSVLPGDVNDGSGIAQQTPIKPLAEASTDQTEKP